MLAVKAVKQSYQLTQELEDVLETFRYMVNFCVHVGLERNITSRFKLSNAVYKELHNGLHTWYILSAVEKATAILRNYRKTKRKNLKTKTPYVRKTFLSIGNQAYRIVDGKLRLPTKPRQFIYIPLNKHTQEVLSDPSLKFGSICLTASTVSISFSKEIAEIEPTGHIGLDRNLDNVTTCNTEDNVGRYDLSEATRIKSVYREVKSHFKRNDVRVRRKIFQKYGQKQRNRVSQILHRTSKKIVEEATENRFSITMENIKGMRKLYRRGNGQGRNYRSRLNSWSFYEFQRQIEYKAKWEGVPIVYVKAGGTSSICAICGSLMRENPNAQRILECEKGHILDRDVNAALNIMVRGVRFAPVNGSSSEGMMQECFKANPETRWGEGNQEVRTLD